MKNITENKLADDLKILSSMKAVGAPDYFYTRLNEKFANKNASIENVYTFKPVIIIGTLTLLLVINSLLLKNDKNKADITSNENMKDLAAAYDQTISN